MVLQCSKKIENVDRKPRTFWGKNYVFHRRKTSYFIFTYIFLLVLLFYQFHIYVHGYIYTYIYIYIHICIYVYYISVPTWTHSQNLLAAAETLSLKASSHGTSLKWPRRTIKRGVVIRYAMKCSIPFYEIAWKAMHKLKIKKWSIEENENEGLSLKHL